MQIADQWKKEKKKEREEGRKEEKKKGGPLITIITSVNTTRRLAHKRKGPRGTLRFKIKLGLLARTNILSFSFHMILLFLTPFTSGVLALVFCRHPCAKMIKYADNVLRI